MTRKTRKTATTAPAPVLPPLVPILPREYTSATIRVDAEFAAFLRQQSEASGRTLTGFTRILLTMLRDTHTLLPRPAEPSST